MLQLSANISLHFRNCRCSNASRPRVPPAFPRLEIQRPYEHPAAALTVPRAPPAAG